MTGSRIPLRSRKCMHCCRGLTLVETVIAMVIVSVMMVAALNTVGAARMGEKTVNESRQARILAQDLLNEILAQAYADASDTPTNFGPTPAEAATGNRSLFNDVNDYNRYEDTVGLSNKAGTSLGYDSSWSREVALKTMSPATATPSGTTDLGLMKVTVTVLKNDVERASVAAMRSSGLPATEMCTLPDGSTHNLAPAHCTALGGSSAGPGSDAWMSPDANNTGIGLVAHWKLDEQIGFTASDSKGNHHGTYINGPLSTTGVVGKARWFDGVNDYVSIPNAAEFQVTESLTIAAWVRGEAWPTSSSGDNGWTSIILRKGDLNRNNWQLSVYQGKVVLHLNEDDDEGVSGNTVLALNMWYHVAAAWDGKDIRIYVNGVLNNTPRARKGPLPTDSRPVYLGGRTGTSDILKGRLDDVRFYNRALSATEITTLYNGGEP
jgi:prepilin-type N-terminal cleavage/methylation domain-containing protein